MAHLDDPAVMSPQERAAVGELTAQDRYRVPEHRTRRQIIKTILMLTLVVLTLYVLGPGLVEVLSSAPRLREIGWWWFPVMLALEAGSFGCLWAVEWISIRQARWWEIINSQLAGNSFGRIIPGGGAAAGALQYRMLVDAGTPGGAAATGLTATNLLTFAVLLGLPVLAIPAVLQGEVERRIVTVLVWALMILVALIVGAVLLIVTDRPLRWIGDHFQRVRNRLLRRRPPLTGLPQRLVDERDLIVDVVGARWKWALLASVGKWILDFGVLLVALEAVGSNPSLSLALLSYCIANLLAQIPITPGGLGFVEAGLTGTLAIAGVSGRDAVLATLAYRLFSYWLPIPVGGVSWLLFRRRHPPDARVVDAVTPA